VLLRPTNLGGFALGVGASDMPPVATGLGAARRAAVAVARELGPPKTPSSYRTLPLPGVVADALAAHLATWPAHAGLGVIFTNERGEPVQAHPFDSMWTTAKTTLDIYSHLFPDEEDRTRAAIDADLGAPPATRVGSVAAR
jgi:hypothetical protein